MLREKAGDPDLVALEQIGAFGDPERDPRTRVITVAYLALVRETFPLPEGSGKLAWFDIGEREARVILRAEDTLLDSDGGIELAFDHGDLLLAAIRIAQRAE